MPNNARRPFSLTLRITVMIGVVTSIIFLAFGWLIERSLLQHFSEQDADELRVVSHAVQQALSSSDNTSDANLSQRLAKAVSGHHGVYFYVADANGNTLHDMPGPNLKTMAQSLTPITDIRSSTLQIWQEQQDHYRGALQRIHRGNTFFTVVVAATMNFHLHYLQAFQRSLWLTTLMACVIVILATWLAVHQGLAPLRQISQRIDDIGSEQLNVRLTTDDVPHELLSLTSAFNQMLTRLEDSFVRLANFSADIAHELRTPITNLSTQTQVALTRARSVDEYREILYSSLEEYERMAKMVADMLYLAQTDNKLLKPTVQTVDLHAEVLALFEYFEAWAEERGVGLTLTGDTPIVHGDRLMLRRALSNLLSNAIRHTHAGQKVSIILSTEADQAHITIANPGSEIPTTHLAKIFDRFYRVDPARQRNDDGAGLGLAIVKSIIDAHGGTVTVISQRNQTEFSIHLPQP